jgi:hypothetical protein
MKKVKSEKLNVEVGGWRMGNRGENFFARTLSLSALVAIICRESEKIRSWFCNGRNYHNLCALALSLTIFIKNSSENQSLQNYLRISATCICEHLREMFCVHLLEIFSELFLADQR